MADPRFNQVGRTFPKRAQDPKPPFPYYEQEVSIPVDDAVLCGTLTLPRDRRKPPVVVLVHGSGPQNRDQDILGHKTFRVLADQIARAGFAVFRYDKRGVPPSSGDFATATTMTFVSDVIGVVQWLKTRNDVDTKQIGLIGHSEGGSVSMIASTRCPDIAFIVSLAGMAVSGKETSLFQLRTFLQENGLPAAKVDELVELKSRAIDVVRAFEDNNEARTRLERMYDEFLRKSRGRWHWLRWAKVWRWNADCEIEKRQKAMAELEIQVLLGPWVRTFFTYDPKPVLESIDCPMLALNGSLDRQIPPLPNLAAIRDAVRVSGNRNVSIVEVPGVNHLFQTCSTGSVSEYERLEETVSPAVLELIIDWLTEQTT